MSEMKNKPSTIPGCQNPQNLNTILNHINLIDQFCEWCKKVYMGVGATTNDSSQLSNQLNVFNEQLTKLFQLCKNADLGSTARDLVNNTRMLALHLAQKEPLLEQDRRVIVKLSTINKTMVKIVGNYNEIKSFYDAQIALNSQRALKDKKMSLHDKKTQNIVNEIESLIEAKNNLKKGLNSPNYTTQELQTLFKKLLAICKENHMLSSTNKFYIPQNVSEAYQVHTGKFTDSQKFFNYFKNQMNEVNQVLNQYHNKFSPAVTTLDKKNSFTLKPSLKQLAFDKDSKKSSIKAEPATDEKIGEGLFSKRQRSKSSNQINPNENEPILLASAQQMLKPLSSLKEEDSGIEISPSVQTKI